MKCPVCRIDMIVVEYEQIELDYCVQCSGVWFDCGELELLLETESAGVSAGAMFTAPKGEVAEKKRRCPLCGKKMAKTLIGESPGVIIDTCPDGEGLWFDGGEVEQVISQMVDKSPEEAGAGGIGSFLSDVFAPMGNKEVKNKE